MTRKVTFTAIPLSIAQSIAFLAALLWFWCGHQMEQSPTVQDAIHQIPFNNHGTIHYLTTTLVETKRIVLIVGFSAIGFTLLNLLYVARCTGRSIGEVFSRIKLFRSIEMEIDEES